MATSYGPYADHAPVVTPGVSIDLSQPAGSTLDPRLASRISCRSFGDHPVGTRELGAILHSAYGELGPATTNGIDFIHRPVPSAGARYPLKLFVLAKHVAELQTGVYGYDIESASLTMVGERPDDDVIASIFLDQPYVCNAPAIIVIAGHLALTLEKYGSRGYRYVLFEAGHLGQNITLGAVGLGMSSLPIGGFLDGELATVIGEDPRVCPPLYGFALGYPSSSDPTIARTIPTN